MISISSKKIIRTLVLVIIGISLINLINQYLKCFPGVGYTRLFDVDHEHSFPTWYSSTTLLICSALLGFIFLVKKQSGDIFTKHWKWLSILFVYLSLDEAISLHELLIKPLRNTFNLTGFLHLPWVIAGIALVVVVFFVYLKFLFNLPPKTRRLFLLAGGIYVVGAVGMEMIGAKFLTDISVDPFQRSTGWPGMSFQILLGIEELLEMTGICVFIHSLLQYISVEVGDVQLHVSSRKASNKARLADLDSVVPEITP